MLNTAAPPLPPKPSFAPPRPETPATQRRVQVQERRQPVPSPMAVWRPPGAPFQPAKRPPLAIARPTVVNVEWLDASHSPSSPSTTPSPPSENHRGRSRGSVRLLKAAASSAASCAASRSGSQAPSLSTTSLATDSSGDSAASKDSKSSWFSRPAAARRSLSRSRLLSCMLNTARQQSIEYFKDTVRSDKKNSIDHYLPTSDGVPFSPFVHNTHLTVKSGAASRPARCMGRAMRVVVAGAKRVGKTAILRQVACIEDITKQPYAPTIEDTYQVLLEDGDRPREIISFHDTAGMPDHAPVELKKAYLQVADAFVLVYSVTDHESFNRVDMLKKLLDKHFNKEKKEIPIVVLGNMTDLPGRKVDSEFALAWSNREKVKLFEVSATDRNSLIDFVHFIGQRHFHPQKESKFSLSKRLKAEKSNAAILMDI